MVFWHPRGFAVYQVIDDNWFHQEALSEEEV